METSQVGARRVFVLGQTDFFEARTTGEPLLVSIDLLDEDPSNPRTEFPDAELDELAEDIREHGVLQPIVVHPADGKVATSSTSAPSDCGRHGEPG